MAATFIDTDCNIAALEGEVVALCRAQARGTYQKRLVEGAETWSGSSLKGNARKWGGRYAASRRDLVSRIAAALAPRGLTTRFVGGTAAAGPKRLAVFHGEQEIVRL